jgi:3-deoxy-D-manno-octulosonic-acid transferase
LANKGGFEINSYEDFETLMDKFLTDEVYLKQSGKLAGDYVKNNSGAMEKIMNSVKL